MSAEGEERHVEAAAEHARQKRVERARREAREEAHALAQRRAWAVGPVTRYVDSDFEGCVE